MYKLGLDIHGVFDKHPYMFIELANNVTLKKSGEVHIITGMPYSEKVQDWLLSFNHGRKWWTDYFSIETSLLEKDVPYEAINGAKYFKPDVWNKEKALYCADKNISLHIDDQMEYLRNFTTPYMYFNDASPKNSADLFELVTAPRLEY